MNNDSVQHKVPVLQVTNHNNAFGSVNPMRKLPKRFSFMDWRQRLLGLLVLLMGLLAAPAAGSNDDDFTQRLHSRGHVLLIRHAEAPGMGDPNGFRLGVCWQIWPRAVHLGPSDKSASAAQNRAKPSG